MLGSTLPFDQDIRSFDLIIQDALHSVRKLLGMEVAFVSEFSKGWRIFRHIDSQPDFTLLRVGGGDPLEDSYCQRVVDGRLPELIRDARRNPEALKLAVTTALPVGAHLSVPIRFSNGNLYGTFCCFSTHPEETLNDRDLGVMRLFGDFVGKMLEHVTANASRQLNIREHLQSVLDRQLYAIFYQPIFDIRSNVVVGHEALIRFLVEPARTPDLWFHEAAEVGLLEELEAATIKKALTGLAQLPETSYLSVNISPESILKGVLPETLEGFPLQRVVLEVTEHTSISDYGAISAALAPLRKQGLRLSVDDAGAGYASFRHILKLKPDVIKLDRSLIQRIDEDIAARALAAAIVRFAEEMDSILVAEGVESEAELAILRSLNIHRVQGFLLGHPRPLDPPM